MACREGFGVSRVDDDATDGGKEWRGHERQREVDGGAGQQHAERRSQQ